MKANHNSANSCCVIKLLLILCQRYEMKANHNIVSLVYEPIKLLILCQRYEMKANHNNGMLIRLGEELLILSIHNIVYFYWCSLFPLRSNSKIRNESKSQQTACHFDNLQRLESFTSCFLFSFFLIYSRSRKNIAIWQFYFN